MSVGVDEVVARRRVIVIVIHIIAEQKQKIRKFEAGHSIPVRSAVHGIHTVHKYLVPVSVNREYKGLATTRDGFY